MNRWVRGSEPAGDAPSAIAAPARRTRDPDATRTRLLRPAVTRAHAPPATSGSNRRAGSGSTAEARRATAARGPARDRRRLRAGAQNADPGRARARLLAPRDPSDERLELCAVTTPEARPAKPRAPGSRRASTLKSSLPAASRASRSARDRDSAAPARNTRAHGCAM